LTNVVAGAISQHDTEELVASFSISTPSFRLLDDLREELTTDLPLQPLRQEIQEGHAMAPGRSSIL
jgi:hypothetical protein